MCFLERRSRLLKITKIPANNSKYVQAAILHRLTHQPSKMRRSITYDNGFENTRHLTINRYLKTKSYFCNPYHSWEKGSVENAIGIIRRFIPKKTNLQLIPATEISRLENLINNRPRKCLNYHTPNEVFQHTLTGALPR
jgi:IS30 family transposase